MKKLLKFLTQKRYWLMGLILLIALFFRAYKLKEFYGFDHDEDLFSLIVKDIVVDHHLRLIGQLTSIEGVFIGPLFYYLLIPFYVLFNMNPLSANVLTILISLSTIASIYFIWTKFFGKTTAIIGGLIYATSLGIVDFDRWVVPTQPTILWTVWYIYCLFALLKGEYKLAIPISTVLIGLIWHIHLALLPLILPLFLAYFLSERKKISPRLLIVSILLFLIISGPFWLFEIKHNFLQSRSLFVNRSGVGAVIVGLDRFYKIIDSIIKVVNTTLFQDWSLPNYLVSVVALGTLILAVVKKYFSLKQTLLMVSYFGAIIVVQMITTNQISEYYFSDLMILPILLVSVFLGGLAKNKKFFWMIVMLIIFYPLINLMIFVNRPEPWHRYKYKEQTIEYIKADVSENGYSCIAINYISRPGVDRGFRYLLWWKGLKLVTTNSGAPIYNIVIPYDLAKNELDAQFHYFGVILPKGIRSFDQQLCADPKYQPIPPLGFTN